MSTIASKLRRLSARNNSEEHRRSGSLDPERKRTFLLKLFNSRDENKLDVEKATARTTDKSSDRQRPVTSRPVLRQNSSAIRPSVSQLADPEIERPSLSARILRFFSPKTQATNHLNNQNSEQFKKVKLDPQKLIKSMKPTYYMKNLEFMFKLKEDNALSTIYKQNFHNNWLALCFSKDIIKAAKNMLEDLPNVRLLDNVRGYKSDQGSSQHPKIPQSSTENMSENVPKNALLKRINLPTLSYKKSLTVVFDLDGTLVSCSDKIKGDFAVSIYYKHKRIDANFFLRPHALQVLTSLSQKYEVVLMSSSHNLYVNAIAEKIDPKREIFSAIFDRSHCLSVGECLIKYLGHLGRDLSRVVLVDDNAKSFLLNPENAIPIVPYLEGKDDIELLTLETYIDWLAKFEDVRKENMAYFGWDKYKSGKTLQEVYLKLFPRNKQ